MTPKSIKDLILEMDALLERGECGQLVVLEDRVELHNKDGRKFIVGDSDSIKLAQYKEDGELYYYPITHKEAISTISREGSPLFAGIKAIVTSKEMETRGVAIQTTLKGGMH